MALKLDGGKLIEIYQWRLLKMFVILDGPSSREYQRAMAVSLSLWSWMHRKGHPGSRLWLENASLWNEEAGEICFSVLARGIAGSGMRSDVKAVSRKFQLIRSKIDVATDLKFDLCGDDFAAKKHRTIKMESKEVKATVVFFERMIRSLTRNVHRHYGPNCGHLDLSARRRQAMRPTVPAVLIPRLSGDVRSRLQKLFDDTDTRISGFWVHAHSSDIWPESIPSPDDVIGLDTEDENEQDDNSGDNASLSRRGRHRPSRKRSRRKSVSSESDEQKADPLVGRTVAVPSWCLGQAWSETAFGGRRAANRARLHGELEPCNRDGEYICRFWHDREYILRLTMNQIRSYVIPDEEVASARDTPYADDYEVITNFIFISSLRSFLCRLIDVSSIWACRVPININEMMLLHCIFNLKCFLELWLISININKSLFLKLTGRPVTVDPPMMSSILFYITAILQQLSKP